jgi:hypothetical protein
VAEEEIAPNAAPTADVSIDELLDKARAEADAAEKDAPPEPKKKRTPPASRGRKKNLTEPLTDMYMSIGMGLMLLNPLDGQVVCENAPKMAKSLNKWGESNPTVYRSLERLCTTSAMGGVIAAHAPVILAIAANHDLLPKLGKKDDQNPNNQAEANPDSGTTQPPGNPTSVVGQSERLAPVIVGTGGTRKPSGPNGMRENHPVTGTTGT